MQVIKHQVPFCFLEFILYLGLYTIALCISASNCVFLIGHMLNKCCYAKLVFHYNNLVFVVVPVWNIGLFLHQNQKGAHWRRLINHLKFDVLAFVFNILSLKRYKF